MCTQDKSGSKPADEPPSKFLKIKEKKGTIKFVSPEDIVLAEAQDHYVLLYYEPEDKLEKVLFRDTLAHLLEKLPGTPCRRINRSYLVNEEMIKEFDSVKHRIITRSNNIIKLEHGLDMDRFL